MKRYMHIAVAAVLSLAYAGAHAEDNRLTMDQMHQMNPGVSIQVEEPTIGPADMQIANQVEKITLHLNKNLNGYSNAELVEWYGKGDNLLTEFLRIGGRTGKKVHLMDEYRQYKQQFQDKFNEHGGVLPGGKRAGIANQPTSASPVRARQARSN